MHGKIFSHADLVNAKHYMMIYCSILLGTLESQGGGFKNSPPFGRLVEFVLQ